MINNKILHGYQRRIFYSKQNITIEIYLENLKFCQEIKIGKKIYLDYPSLSPTDLFLSKIQRIDLDHEDMFDIKVLLLQYAFSPADDRNINIEYISKLCRNDWRWWNTLKENIAVLSQMNIDFKEQEDELLEKLATIEAKLNRSKKSFKWKLRKLIGERIAWYNHVD